MGMAEALYALGGYLAGSIPFAVIVSLLMALPDPRTYGSGNIGATNVLRSGNRLAALLTLGGDAGKGWAAVLVAQALGATDFQVSLVGFSAFIGHVFPVWLRFNGGKGVATAAGVPLPLHRRPGPPGPAGGGARAGAGPPSFSPSRLPRRRAPAAAAEGRESKEGSDDRQPAAPEDRLLRGDGAALRRRARSAPQRRTPRDPGGRGRPRPAPPRGRGAFQGGLPHAFREDARGDQRRVQQAAAPRLDPPRREAARCRRLPDPRAHPRPPEAQADPRRDDDRQVRSDRRRARPHARCRRLRHQALQAERVGERGEHGPRRRLAAPRRITQPGPTDEEAEGGVDRVEHPRGPAPVHPRVHPALDESLFGRHPPHLAFPH